MEHRLLASIYAEFYKQMISLNLCELGTLGIPYCIKEETEASERQSDLPDNT